MSRFLALIVAAAMSALGGFLAGPAMAQVNIVGEVTATGEVTVSGEVIFQETDVQFSDEEVINKFFELDSNVTSTWTIEGTGIMNVAQWFQSGTGNVADILQNPTGLPHNQMNVAAPYQFGNLNAATITQYPSTDPGISSSNFASGSQIGEANVVNLVQNFP